MTKLNDEDLATLNAQRKHLASEYPKLRDSFAMSALGSFQLSPAYLLDERETLVDYVKLAYEIADIMLLERDNKNT